MLEKRWGTVRGCFGSEPMRGEDKLESEQQEDSEGTRNSSLQSLGDLGKEMGRREKRLISWGRQHIWLSVLKCENAPPWEMAGVRQAVGNRISPALFTGYPLTQPSPPLLRVSDLVLSTR